MIRVTVEMWPQGDETRKYPLGHADIWNEDTGSNPLLGNYSSRFFSKTGRLLKRSARIVGWPRTAKPVFSLVRRMLEEAGY